MPRPATQRAPAFEAEAVLEHASDAVAVVDRDWRILYVNAALERMVGKDRQSMFGRIGWEVFPAALGTSFEEQFRKAMAEQVPVEFEAFYLPLSIWLEVRAFPSPQTLTILFRDITAQKRAAEAHLAEERFRNVFAEGPLGMHVVGLDHRYVQVNAMFCRMLGYSEAEILGRRIEDFTHPDDMALDGALPDRMVRDGLTSTCREKRYIRKDGTVFWARRTVAAIHNHAGEVECFFGMIEDITGRKEAEDALRDSEARQRAFFDLAIVGLGEADPRTGKFLRVNQMLCDLTGYQREELLQKTYRDITYPEDRESDTGKFLAMLADPGVPYRNEKRYVRKDGTLIWVEVNVAAVRDEQGRPIRTAAVIRDISAYKEAERAIQLAREEAEAANRSKDQFLAVLSHELRTPLMPVLTTVQLMEADEGLSLEQREQIAMIRRNVQLESRLIDDLLDVTRISRGKLELHLRTVDLHEKIRLVVAMCRHNILAKELKLSVQEDAVVHHVEGDAARLQQVLWNLLTNAIKFTPAGGAIAIRSANTDARRVTVVVEDTGVGIAPEALPHIFNAFEQGGKDVTRKFGGMGLGLAISKSLAEMHGGTLMAQSEGPRKGATFTLELPAIAAEESEEYRERGVQAGLDLGHMRVLLVEDHRDTAKIMSSLLRRYGCEVRIADSVASALELGEAEPFDLLISDIGLPDGSGVEVMRRLAHLYRIKGIALSGYGMQEDIRRSKDAGFAAHLTKPVDVSVLEETLRGIAGR